MPAAFGLVDHRPDMALLRTAFWLGLGAIAVGACTCDDPLARLRGSVEVTPTMLDFGKVPVGGEKSLTLNVKNRGSATLELQGLEVQLPFLAPAVTTTIGPGVDRNFEISFRPSAVGPANGTLIVRSDDKEIPAVEVPVIGEGIEAAVRVEPLVVDFGEVLWLSNTAMMAREVTISNPGSDNFDLTSIDLIENGSGAFSIDLRSAVGTYAPGASQTFEVRYLPNAFGVAMGSVRLRTTTSAAPEITVTLLARAVGPIMEVCAGISGGQELCTAAGQQPRLDFVVERSAMGTGAVRVLNTGDRDLSAQGQLIGMANEFAITPDVTMLGAFTLAPGAERRFDLIYTPSDYQFDAFNLGLVSNAAGRPSQLVRVEGRVPKPTIAVVPRTVTFTLQGAANRSESRVKIANCGELPLQVTAVPTIRQTMGNGFTMTNPPAAGTTVQPGSCANGQPAQDAPGAEFTVVFMPGGNGLYEAEITVSSNDPSSPTVVVQARGDKRP